MSRRQSPASKAKRKSRYPSVDAIRKRPFPTGALSSAWRLRDQEINLLSPVDWVGQQHAIARNRALSGLALGYVPEGEPDFGLAEPAPVVAGTDPADRGSEATNRRFPS